MPKLKETFQSRSSHVGTYSLLSTLAVIAVMVLINLLVSHVPSSISKIDLTNIGLFTLTEQTETLVSSLEDDVEITLVSQSGTEDATIVELLSRYADLSEKIHINYVDPIVNPTFATQYTSGQVNNNSVVITCGNRYYYADFYDIYLYDYTVYNYTGNEQDIVANFDGENVLSGGIDYVTSDNLPTVYMLTGHGEAILDSTFVRAAASENFDLLDFSFLTAENIPEDCDCLFINAPSSDISADEAAKIRSYLEEGGQLLVVTNYPTREKPNLLGLLEYYGMTVADGVVMDADANHSLYGYYHYLLPDLLSHTITDPLRESGYYVCMPLSEGLQIITDKRENVTIYPLLQTSTSAYAKVTGYQFQTYDWEPGDGFGPFYLGLAASENTYSEDPTKICWYSSSFLLDSSTNDVVSGGNMDLFLNTLGWLCGQESSITIHSKDLTPDYLTVPSSDVNRWSLVIIALVPGLVLIAGIVVMVYRRRR